MSQASVFYIQEKVYMTALRASLEEDLNKVILSRKGIYKVFILLDPRLRADYESGFNQRFLEQLDC